MRKNLVLYLLIMLVLFGCSSDPKNGTALEAADVFMQGMISGDSNTLNKINHSEPQSYPTKHLIDIANERNLLSLSKSDIKLEIYDDKTILVTFPESNHSPFALLFNQEKDGYFFKKMDEYSFYSNEVTATSGAVKEEESSNDENKETTSSEFESAEAECYMKHDDERITDISGDKYLMTFRENDYRNDQNSSRKFPFLKVNSRSSTIISQCNGVLKDTDEGLYQYTEEKMITTNSIENLDSGSSFGEGGVYLLLPKPIEPNAEWYFEKYNSNAEENYVARVDDLKSNLETDYKTFDNAVKIIVYKENTKENYRLPSLIYYYVEGLGIVKHQNYKVEQGENSEWKSRLIYESQVATVEKFKE